MIETFSDEERATLTSLVKVLKQLQDLCGLTAFGAGLAGVVCLCSGGGGMAGADETFGLVLAILAFAASPVFFVSAVFTMKSARTLMDGLREGADTLMWKLRRTALSTIPPALTAAVAMGAVVWIMFVEGVPQIAVVLFYIGIYGVGASAAPVLTLFVMIRYGHFIQGVLHAPIPREQYGEDAFDEFVAAARGRKGKQPRTRKTREPRHE